MPTKNKTYELPFRPRARLLQLLGDQLIGTPRLAVFELVKNAYDADADNVVVTIKNPESEDAEITVEDDGLGMTLDTILNIWLTPADDNREVQRKAGRVSKKGRLPLGEKGLGRLAVHKLGDSLEVVTRAAKADECVIEIDWREFLKNEFLSDAFVKINTRSPEYFKGRKTGTRITIKNLRGRQWTRGEVRKLSRQITAMGSPFDLNILGEKEEKPLPVKDFTARLAVPGYEDDWLDDLHDVTEILKLAFWHVQFRFDGEKFYWKYKFSGVPQMRLEPKNLEGAETELKVPDLSYVDEEGATRAKRAKLKKADNKIIEGIGPISGEFYVFDLDNSTRQLVPDLNQARDYLSWSGGVRVYRDGIRVYNYGEPGDDWLELDLSRVQNPTKYISKNLVAGAINLSLEQSTGLIEKASREGFDENETFQHLQEIVRGALRFFLPERSKDKGKIRLFTKKQADPEIQKIRKPLKELRRIAEEKNVLSDLEDTIKKIEIDFEEMKETMLHAGMPGRSLMLVFHEVVRGVDGLVKSAERGEPAEVLLEQATHLNTLLNDISAVLRTEKIKKQSARNLIIQAVKLLRGRFDFHDIEIVSPFLEEEGHDLEIKFSLPLLLNCLTNVLDNSVYWLKYRWSDLEDIASKKRKIYINITEDFFDAPFLVIADTGPGFREEDTPMDLVRPFFSRRQTEDDMSGMGLGLYYVNLALGMNNAELIFPEGKNVGVPKGFDGAVVGFLFVGEDEH